LCANSCTTRAVAEVLCKHGVVFLNSGDGAAVALSNGPVDYIETIQTFIQAQLVVCRLRVVVVINGAKFDVEDTIRRGA
jgi:hypothetical protein